MCHPQRSVLFVIVLMSAFAGVTPGQELDFKVIAAGIRENGERLRQGEFTAQGTVDHKQHHAKLEDKPSLTDDETIDCAFDHDQEKLFFSRVRDRRSNKGGSQAQKWTKGTLILRPDSTVEAYQNDPEGIANVGIFGPLTRQSAPGYFQPVFDPRTLCMSNLHNTGIEFDQIVSNFENSSANVTKTPEGLWKLQWDYFPTDGSKIGERYFLWVDPQQGMQIVRKAAIAGEIGKITDDKPAYMVSETTWTKVKGVWVIHTVDISQGANQYNRMRMAFTWKSVNEPIPESRFRWEDAELPSGTQVADASIVDGLIVPLEIVGKPAEYDLPAPVTLPKSRSSSRLLIPLNMALLGLVLGVILRKRKRDSLVSPGDAETTPRV